MSQPESDREWKQAISICPLPNASFGSATPVVARGWVTVATQRVRFGWDRGKVLQRLGVPSAPCVIL